MQKDGIKVLVADGDSCLLCGWSFNLIKYAGFTCKGVRPCDVADRARERLVVLKKGSNEVHLAARLLDAEQAVGG